MTDKQFEALVKQGDERHVEVITKIEDVKEDVAEVKADVAAVDAKVDALNTNWEQDESPC